MAEFKFFCSQCKQHIKCDVSYVSSRINCPACQQAIVVPQPPTVVPSGERVLQIKFSLLRKVALGFAGILAAAGIASGIFYLMGNSTRSVWNNWSPLSGNSDQWSFSDGKIHAHSSTGDSILASAKEYGDVTLSATVSTVRSDNREASLAIRMQDASNGYLIIFAPAGTTIPGNHHGYMAIVKRVNGTETFIAKYNGKMPAVGTAAKLRADAQGLTIEVRFNGKKILSANDSTFASGRIGLRIFGDPNFPCDATYSRVSFHY